MRIAVLGSGSKGNLLLVSTSRTCLLIDAGLSPKELERRAARLNGGPLRAQPTALFLTHEHDDHTRYASAYADRGVALYATAGTRRGVGLPNHKVARVHDGVAVVVGDLAVEAVALPHDAAEPVGYLISDGVSRVGVLTDCGTCDPVLIDRYAGVDLLLLEFNHDPMLLEGGPYPRWLKRRIASDRGHLSNAAAARLLAGIVARGKPPRLVVLGHLSQINNRPRIAMSAALAVMQKPSALLLATQDEPTPWLDPAAPGGRVASASEGALHGEQLVLRLVSE